MRVEPWYDTLSKMLVKCRNGGAIYPGTRGVQKHSMTRAEEREVMWLAVAQMLGYPAISLWRACMTNRRYVPQRVLPNNRMPLLLYDCRCMKKLICLGWQFPITGTFTSECPPPDSCFLFGLDPHPFYYIHLLTLLRPSLP